MSRNRKKEAVSIETVRHLANLSRLSLTPAEERRLVGEMGEIVSYFATIDKAKVERLEPSYHAAEAASVLREDRSEPYEADSILKIVPNKKGRYVKAPRVF